jgi:hypothetical protein
MPQMPSGMLPPPAKAVRHANPHRHWDEDKVVDWLKRINCAQYIELFKRTPHALPLHDVS